MKKTVPLIVCIFLFAVMMDATYAQVGINSSNNPPYTSAILDVSSTSKGILIPRMWQSDRLGISPLTEGLMVYQTDGAQGFYYWDGDVWIRISDKELWIDDGNYLYPAGPIANGLQLADNESHQYGLYANMNTGASRGEGAHLYHENTSGDSYGIYSAAIFNGTNNTGVTTAGYFYSLSTTQNQSGIINAAIHTGSTGNLKGIDNSVTLYAGNTEPLIGIYSITTRQGDENQNDGLYSIAEGGTHTSGVQGSASGGATSNTGVSGSASGGLISYGVYGHAVSGDQMFGVYGYASTSSNAYGVYGKSSNWGGGFENYSSQVYVRLAGSSHAMQIEDGNEGAGKVLTSDASGNASWQSLPAATAPGGSNGHVQFNNSGSFGGDANLFWDNTNKRLGIGDNTPSSTLEVAGDIRISNVNGSFMIGSYEALHIPSFSDNISAGANSGQAITTGRQNAFFGDNAGAADNTAWDNTFVGHNTGRFTTSGGSNTFLGSNAGSYHSIGTHNVFLGYQAGFSTANSVYNPTRNTFVGGESGYTIHSGSYNTFLGNEAGRNATDGSYNVFLGYQAGYNEGGSNKLYIHNNSSSSPLIYGEFDNSIMRINGRLGIFTAPSSDAALHVDYNYLYAGYFTSSYNNVNTHVVEARYEGNTTQDGRAFYGVSQPVANANYGVGGEFIGNWYGVNAGCHPGTSSGISFGVRSVIDGDAGTRYGVAGYANAGTTRYGVYGEAATVANSYGVYCNGNGHYTGTWSFPSDQRLKQNLADLPDALKIVNQLRVRSYEYKRDEFDFIHLADGKHYGFEAQELEKILPELVGTARIPISDEKNPEMFEYMTVNTIELVPVLTRAIQQQQEMIEEQQEMIRELQEKVEMLGQ